MGNFLVFLPLFRLYKNRFPQLPLPDTAICIEAYPRSANTYFVSGFQMWNSRVNVAHHSHLAGSLKFAIKHGLPAVVLIRKPEDAIASTMAWDNLLTSSVALLAYIHFYYSLRKYRNRVLILQFEDVVRSPDKCVDHINQRFGTDFNFTQFTPAVDQIVRERIQKGDERNNRNEVNSTLPNQTKDELKQQQIDQLLNRRMYLFAQRLYLDFKQCSAKQWLAYSPDINNT